LLVLSAVSSQDFLIFAVANQWPLKAASLVPAAEKVPDLLNNAVAKT
jgi:hypothetical protein